ncbi:hypothetical protein GH714_032502 [Hevea brasiliensis]|uniref:Protein kinase domain-containing protein n=1 Tax=Hevea brasiliensis TaxID=3981 RepID=A0A6A6L1P3_HEVBR|nr:hypothetical protein GH714_032502 [Hevea brasiliensis]
MLPDAVGPGYCYRSVFVPVSELNLATAIISLSSLEGSLKQGFQVKWKVDDTTCTNCIGSKGVCGYDHLSKETTCYCLGQFIPTKTCTSSPDIVPAIPGGKSSKVGLGVGIGIAGAAAVCIGLGCWLLLIRQRRKRIAAQTKSKGQPTPPSSKGEPAPIINFSQTTPTYPSLNSDLEKGSTYFGTRVFSYEELVEATDNFNPSKELGDGGFGTVYYGVLNDGRVVAVKRLFENNMRRAEQFMNEIEILTRLRHKNLVSLHRLDINLANMAVNKIQNHAVNELIDPCLGFEKDSAVRKMATSVAELAFRCLQQERDMRPTMREVLEALKRIEKENYVSEKADVVDIKEDDVGLLNNVPPFSPDSIGTTDKWEKMMRTL